MTCGNPIHPDQYSCRTTVNNVTNSIRPLQVVQWTTGESLRENAQCSPRLDFSITLPGLLFCIKSKSILNNLFISAKDECKLISTVEHCWTWSLSTLGSRGLQVVQHQSMALIDRSNEYTHLSLRFFINSDKLISCRRTKSPTPNSGPSWIAAMLSKWLDSRFFPLHSQPVFLPVPSCCSRWLSHRLRSSS